MAKRKQLATAISAEHRRKLDAVRRKTGVTIVSILEAAIEREYKRVSKR